MASYSEAGKARWKNIPKEVRTERMRKLGKLRQEKMTEFERKELSRKMIEGRKRVD